jgi:hypothetical protein
VGTDPNIAKDEWSPEQGRINDAITPVMKRFANQLLSVGNRSDNPTLQDFAALAAQYRNAYVIALPTYVPADKYLSSASMRLTVMVNAACRAGSS